MAADLEYVSSDRQSEAKADVFVGSDITKEVDLVAYYEEAAGRLVVDPQYVATILSLL